MIQVQSIKENGHYKKFIIDGHAGYADAGEDIVCAAVSALVINTINSIEEFTEDAFTCDCQDGMIQNWEFTSEVSAGTELLMDALLLGLTNIQKSYGDEYLAVTIKEKP
ncbi:MAG: ribosomal-processing cysteine protease Prp [Clostridiales bacterium]|nr:ribosomal-processing cysteine protease Prp [Clostridiales bacterium]